MAGARRREKRQSLIVAGDVTVDWLAFRVDPAPESQAGAAVPNWRLFQGTQMVARAGGAFLLTEMVRHAVGNLLRVAGPSVPPRLENVPPSAMIHSLVEIGPFPVDRRRKDEKVYRVASLGGFAGPSEGTPKLSAVEDDDPDASLVVLDDNGNGFRDAVDAWPRAIEPGRRPIVIYKMGRPLDQGALWDRIRRHHANRTVLVVNADDLRPKGVQISRRLSWERTAEELAWQLANNPELAPLEECKHLVIRFDLDGALHWQRGGDARLYFDPAVEEEGFLEEYDGRMLGYGSAFVAALAERALRSGDDSTITTRLAAVGQGVREGIHASRRLQAAGFSVGPSGPEYPTIRIFGSSGATTRLIQDVLVPGSADLERPGNHGASTWQILDTWHVHLIEDLAYQVVLRGIRKTLAGAPIGRFGALRTVDRREIESYRGIKNLVREYLARGRGAAPLSIAVFGPPGSGKSFGITQVATSIEPDRVEKIEFNVAQFHGPDDLVHAFHRVRDIALMGKTPLVFFDEFDTLLAGQNLGWVRYFLAPMQDGRFDDRGASHPIGMAIFVFAGGTSTSYQEFCRRADEHKQEKVPDFISRLRGHVDVLGPNPVGEGDRLFRLRRSLLLRQIVERKARHLIQGESARIDVGVVRAMIEVPSYRHGARSMEAILDMSLLAQRRSFEQSAIPPVAQLDMHVDGEKFYDLLHRFGPRSHEALARAIHEAYLQDQRSRGRRRTTGSAESTLPWDALDEKYKESNRQQADHIPTKLRLIGLHEDRRGKAGAIARFTQPQIEELATIEHERWEAERRLAGWALGDRDNTRLYHPNLVPWDRLFKSVQDIDRKAVAAIPKHLARVGRAVYRTPRMGPKKI
jgi:hypothetical protein